MEPRYRPYRARLPASRGASRDAAAAAAAHHAPGAQLSRPGARGWTGRCGPRSPPSPTRPPGQTASGWGNRPGAAMFAERGKDGAGAPDVYRPFTAPGQYAPTVLPAASSWGAVRPFALESGSSGRPPPRAHEPRVGEGLQRSESMGAKTGSTRTAEQTDIARFWEMMGAACYFPMVRQRTVGETPGQRAPLRPATRRKPWTTR